MNVHLALHDYDEILVRAWDPGLVIDCEEIDGSGDVVYLHGTTSELVALVSDLARVLGYDLVPHSIATLDLAEGVDYDTRPPRLAPESQHEPPRSGSIAESKADSVGRSVRTSALPPQETDGAALSGANLAPRIAGDTDCIVCEGHGGACDTCGGSGRLPIVDLGAFLR